VLYHSEVDNFLSAPHVIDSLINICIVLDGQIIIYLLIWILTLESWYDGEMCLSVVGEPRKDEAG